MINAEGYVKNKKNHKREYKKNRCQNMSKEDSQKLRKHKKNRIRGKNQIRTLI